MARKNSRVALKPQQTWPVASVVLALLMVLIFFGEEHALRWNMIEEIFRDFSFSWQDFLASPLAESPKLISHLFLHADQSHLVNNVIFFLLFAPWVERSVGSLWFIFTFFLAGACAALVQGFFTPFQGAGVGASGAISGIAGAFFVLSHVIGKSKIRLIFGFVLTGLWFLSQLKMGFLSLEPHPLFNTTWQIGYWAHVGGFGVGALSTTPFLFPKKMNFSHFPT